MPSIFRQLFPNARPATQPAGNNQPAQAPANEGVRPPNEQPLIYRRRALGIPLPGSRDRRKILDQLKEQWREQGEDENEFPEEVLTSYLKADAKELVTAHQRGAPILWL